jgi:enoyl-[acyl-carrier-protein] reductase (NADH)
MIEAAATVSAILHRWIAAPHFHETGLEHKHEVANLVIYLASPVASATTGAALRVDGGVANFIL